MTDQIRSAIVALVDRSQIELSDLVSDTEPSNYGAEVISVSLDDLEVTIDPLLGTFRACGMRLYFTVTFCSSDPEIGMEIPFSRYLEIRGSLNTTGRNGSIVIHDADFIFNRRLIA